jgi:hypothetical protein
MYRITFHSGLSSEKLSRNFLMESPFITSSPDLSTNDPISTLKWPINTFSSDKLFSGYYRHVSAPLQSNENCWNEFPLILSLPATALAFPRTMSSPNFLAFFFLRITYGAEPLLISCKLSSPTRLIIYFNLGLTLRMLLHGESVTL